MFLPAHHQQVVYALVVLYHSFQWQGSHTLHYLRVLGECAPRLILILRRISFSWSGLALTTWCISLCHLKLVSPVHELHICANHSPLTLLTAPMTSDHETVASFAGPSFDQGSVRTICLGFYLRVCVCDCESHSSGKSRGTKAVDYKIECKFLLGNCG